MRFDTNRPVKIVMLGAGGTGGHIAPHLYRLLYSLRRLDCHNESSHIATQYRRSGSESPLELQLFHNRRPVRFIIADGDIVEEKNLVRQNFSRAELYENKAKALAERYSAVFGLEAEYVPEYIENEEKLQELIQPQIWNENYTTQIIETVILIGAVDNNKSRKLCNAVFQKAKHNRKRNSRSYCCKLRLQYCLPWLP